MTTPITDTTTPQRTSLLGRIFGKIQGSPQPPAGLEDRLSYTDKVGSNGTDAAYFFHGSIPNYDSPISQGYFPTVLDQESLLTHYDRPPADVNPQSWWDERNTWAVQQRTKLEQQTAVPWSGDTTKPGVMADDPRWNPPTVSRPTSFQNPSSYRFTRDYDQAIEHELNGVHLSLADNRRAYMLSGNVGRMTSWNNSYRLDPISNDSQAVFVGDTVANNVNTSVIYNVSDIVTSRRSFRL